MNQLRRPRKKIPIQILGLSLITLLFSCTNSAKNLPKKPGIEAVKRNCLSCHQASKFMGQNKSKPSWVKTILWMQKMQGMRVISQDEIEQISNYLHHYAGKKNLSSKP